MTLTQAILENGKVVDGSRYPQVIYEVDSAALQPHVAVTLRAGLTYEIVNHAYRPGRADAAQNTASCQTLRDALEVLEGR